MNLAHYEFSKISNQLSIEFFSEGPKGRIKKIIQFTKLMIPNDKQDIYNLGFGDYNEFKLTIDDLIISNNKDSEKILATIAAATISFTEKYRGVYIFAQGSTPSRTRFYVIGVSRYLKQIENIFDIWGAINENEWESFKKDRPYKALLARRR